MKLFKKIWASAACITTIVSMAACGVGDPNEVSASGGNAAQDTVTYALAQTPSGIFNPSLYGLDYDRPCRDLQRVQPTGAH